METAGLDRAVFFVVVVGSFFPFVLSLLWFSVSSAFLALLRVLLRSPVGIRCYDCSLTKHKAHAVSKTVLITCFTS